MIWWSTKIPGVECGSWLPLKAHGGSWRLMVGVRRVWRIWISQGRQRGEVMLPRLRGWGTWSALCSRVDAFRKGSRGHFRLFSGGGGVQARMGQHQQWGMGLSPQCQLLSRMWQGARGVTCGHRGNHPTLSGSNDTGVWILSPAGLSRGGVSPHSGRFSTWHPNVQSLLASHLLMSPQSSQALGQEGGRGLTMEGPLHHITNFPWNFPRRTTAQKPSRAFGHEALSSTPGTYWSQVSSSSDRPPWDDSGWFPSPQG